MIHRGLLLVLVLGTLSGVASADERTANRYALLEEVRVEDAVDGDVVALGSNVVLTSSARVGGDVVAVFGSVEVEPGAVVEGRTVALTSLAALLPERINGEVERNRFGIRALTAGFWLVLTTGLATLLPVWCRRGCRHVAAAPVRVAVFSVLSVATFVAVLVALLGLSPVLSMPLVTAAVLAAVLVKGAGLAVLGALIGGSLLGRLTPRLVPVSIEVFVGVAGLLMVRFIPWLGSPLWTAVSVLAVGMAALTVLERPLLAPASWTAIDPRQP